MKKRIIISGFGGQGVLFAGNVLGHAAMKQGWYVTLFPSYGAEMRGGTANCQITISEDPIGAPVVYEPDILIAFNKPSYEKFALKIKKDGIVLSNASLYSPKKHDNITIAQIPANNIAEKCGSTLSLNMVMLGALAAKTQIISIESVIDSIPEVLGDRKKAFWEVNKKAAQAGYSYIN